MHLFVSPTQAVHTPLNGISYTTGVESGILSLTGRCWSLIFLLGLHRGLILRLLKMRPTCLWYPGYKEGTTSNFFRLRLHTFLRSDPLFRHLLFYTVTFSFPGLFASMSSLTILTQRTEHILTMPSPYPSSLCLTRRWLYLWACSIFLCKMVVWSGE